MFLAYTSCSIELCQAQRFIKSEEHVEHQILYVYLAWKFFNTAQSFIRLLSKQ